MPDHEEDSVISMAERRDQAQARAAEAARRQAREQARRDGRPIPKPWVTWTLIGLNAAVWIVMVALGVDFYEPTGEALLRFGGNFGVLTTSGQWWRLVTAMFLHGGVVHLGFNLYFLWAIGRACEQTFGAAAYTLVYMGSGILASLVAVAWEPGAVNVGASGALFGVFGAFLAFTIRRRESLPPEFVSSVRRNALFLIVINVAIGLTVPNIGLAAHIGGLVAGFAIGYGIARLAEKPVATQKEARALRLRVTAMMSAATIVVALAGALALPRWDNPMPVFDAVEARRVAVLREYQGEQSVDARIVLLDQRVIPALREGQAELAELERLPGRLRELVDTFEQAYALELRAYERELVGLRSGDPAALAEARQLRAEVAELRTE